MYKALNLATQQDIIILSPAWTGQLPALRALDRQDLLVCPACRRPVRVRAGRFRRRHFAHKHLENCPYQSASPLLLEARAVLYEWLVAQFGEEGVELEVQLEVPGIRKPLDCRAPSQGGPVAYWIIERRMPPGERQKLSDFFAGSGIAMQWIFASAMLSTGANPRTVYLTTTEREFMRHSEYDDLYGNWRGDPGMTLHYLDPGRRGWITYRSLRIMHPPQAFRGHRLASPLERVSAGPVDGEPVHPGEGALLEGLRVQKAEHERRAAERLRSYEHLHERFHLPDPPPEPADPWQPFAQEATCVFCGQRTSDWWYINKADGTCKCRPCKDKGLA